MNVPTRMRLAARLREEIVRFLRAGLPFEAVGLLAAWPETADGEVVATCFYPGRNLDASPTRYTMAPEDVLAALHDMDEHGWRLGGIVHSHPNGPATPSRTDRREYRYPETVMVIASLAGDTPELRAWWLGERNSPEPAEVPVTGETPGAPVAGR